jgi:hypothetical protein
MYIMLVQAFVSYQISCVNWITTRCIASSGDAVHTTGIYVSNIFIGQKRVILLDFIIIFI